MSNISSRCRVVITGLSVVSPLGNTIAELSKQVFGGISGIKLLDVPFADKLDCKIAAQASFDPADHFTKHTYGMLDRTSQMALHTSIEAVKHRPTKTTHGHLSWHRHGWRPLSRRWVYQVIS